MRKASLLGSDRGFTVLELLVASTLGLTIIASGLSLTTILRNAYQRDIGRARLNQDLRAALDVVGAAVRQAGEGFTGTFPAIEVVNGAAAEPDELVLRRELLSEEPNVCVDITAGSARGNIQITNSAPTTGCAYSGNTLAYTMWRDYRLAQGGGSVMGYIFNTGTRLGEFFDYTSEASTTSLYRLVASGGTWANSYPVGSSQLYVLEEWRFKLDGDELHIIENELDGDPWRVGFGITDFQVRVHKSDGTTVDAFTRADDWTDVAAIEVTIAGEEPFAGTILTGSLSGRYFPRNVLSN